MIRQPSELKNSNIWEEAGKAKKKDKAVSGQQKTLIIVGDPLTGKSSFIKIIRGDLDFQTKPTCLLQYTYIKKMAVKKQLLHCYEIASKSLSDVISSLITKDNYMDVYLVVCVDLQKPNNMVDQIVQWLKILRKQIDTFLQQKMIIRDQKYGQFIQDISQKAMQSEDKAHITSMPLQTIVVGCKYDLLQKYDTENRKWISRCLRYLAHINNCSLFYASTKNMQASAQLRTTLHDFLFQQKKNKQFAAQKEHTKPIFIMNGTDSISSMSLPSSSGSLGTIDILKKQISSLFPGQQIKKKEPIDPSKYMQTKIDLMIQQKRKELNRMTKNLKNQGKSFSTHDYKRF